MAKSNQRLANWLNLRSVVIVLALFALIEPAKPGLLDWVDRALFSVGKTLMSPPNPDVDVAVITLPESELVALQNDWGNAENLNHLLNQLLRDKNRAVGIVHDQLPMQYMAAGQNLLREIGQSELPSSDTKTAITRYNETRRNLITWFQSSRTVNGVAINDEALPKDHPFALIPLEIEPTAASDLVRWLPPWLLKTLPEISSIPNSLQNESEEQVDSLFELTLFLPHQSLEKSLLFNVDGKVYPEFILSLYAKRGGQQAISWQQNLAVNVDNARLPLSADGSFNGYYNHEEGENTLLPIVPLRETGSSLPSESMVIIGAENSPALLQAAYDLLSLDNQHYFYSSAWLPFIKIGSILFILFYCVILLPRMSYTAAVFASCLLLLVFVVAQMGWQITQWQFLPLGLSIQLLVAGHLLMLLWLIQRENWNKVQAAAHGARYQLGLQLFRDGRADDALLAIKECFSSDAVLNLMYDIASQQERKRQYGEAVKTYQAIVERHSSFRDVREKIEKLIAFSSGAGTGSFGVDTSISKTLIISESAINKPVLGRYEIEREIGRGAMGVVYLGRDPKIARQVAIKTLSYNNISGKELDEFKVRFFREAEAAGRLNHPNIVTVYDVGEEHDLAFIAMDYVEGISLGEHSGADSLLPVKDVYRIVIDVAEALNYAHDKQVVHRDIKPSNILYDPKSGKVKVSDFGVARIVDNARTQTGDILGSPLYMSPEQLKGAKVTNSTDIYSLGVTFYQLLTGKLPHGGDSLANLTYHIINEKPPGVRDIRPDLPKSLTRILNKAMHKDATKRYPSAESFATALRKAMADDFSNE